MTKRDLVIKKLGFLQEHLVRLRQRRGHSLAEFAANRDLQDATGMSFIAAVQEAVDLSLHIATGEALGMPGSFNEGFALLASNSILPNELAERLSDVVRVRHRVVHGYASVDFARFWRELPDGIQTLEQFSAALAKWLGDPPKER